MFNITLRGLLMRHIKPNYTAATYYFGKNAEQYDANRIEKPRWAEENRIILAYVERLPRTSSLLDVPFGTGRFAPAYISAGLRVSGVDISGDMIKAAKRSLGELSADFDLRIARAEKLPFPDQSFDFLICNRFIKWLPSQDLLAQVAAEFRRVCRKEMLIQVKVSKRGLARLGVHIRKLLTGAERSYRATTSYSLSQLVGCFAQGGWSITDIIDAPSVGREVQYLVIRRIAD
jgi:ubiquinone/menaquinone biosynthesis C-methylase UbiE